MKASQFPKKIEVPFAVNGPRQDLQATEIDGSPLASYADGFPPITMLDKNSGGLPPQGKDFNQILYELSSTGQWSAAGGIYQYDSGFSTSIGGYPMGAVVLGLDGLSMYQSQRDNNTDSLLLNSWALLPGNASDYLKKTALASSDGFQFIGQAASFDSLKTIIPATAGQRILLASYAAGTGVGGGEFEAIAGSKDSIKGIIASVNANFHWKRVIKGPLTVEMFGAVGDAEIDDAPAIRDGMSIAASLGINNLRGDGVYAVGSLIYVYSGIQAGGQVSGLNKVIGFDLYLNSVKVITSSWPSLPDEWWNAQAVFQVAPADVEGFNLTVNFLDCGGVAHGFSTVGGRLNTSSIYIGECKNHIIAFRNYQGQTGQSGNECKLSGLDWSYGYLGVLHGGTGEASSNGECLDINVEWLADNRYGGILFQDRSQYSAIMSGTYDYNGQWASLLTLTGLSSNGPYDVIFGNEITNGTVSSYALSSLMSNGVLDGGNMTLLVTESANKKDGVSDYTVGDVITFGSWSATISSIKLTSAIDGQISYFDIIVSNRTADFSKCKIMPTYAGGIFGHNLFTNWIINPNSYDTVKSMNWRGISFYGGANSLFQSIEHIYGSYPIWQYYADHAVLNTNLDLNGFSVYSSKTKVIAATGTPVTVASFTAADSEDDAAYYTLTVGASDDETYAFVLLRVGASAIKIIQNPFPTNISISISGFTLQATVTSGSPTLTASIVKNI